MRKVVDRVRLRQFMERLSTESGAEGRLYFTGGATALLFGWRESTIDLDIKLVPESDQALRAIPKLKEALEINVELASPSDFIPELPGTAALSFSASAACRSTTTTSTRRPSPKSNVRTVKMCGTCER